MNGPLKVLLRSLKRGARQGEERMMMRNRLGLALAALAAALLAQGGDAETRAFVHSGSAVLAAYLAATAILFVASRRRPEASPLRLALAFALDALAISTAMALGGGAGAYLFPLYGWMVLGAGARLGAGFLGLAMVLALAGFSFVLATTEFWLIHPTLGASLALSLVVLPLHGAQLWRHIALARAQAERANAAKTLFLASVSHELRTPLTAILGLTALLEQGGLDAEQREMTRTLAEAAQNLRRQIECLLEGARDEAGADRADEEDVDLYALLMSLRDLLDVEARAKGVALGLLIEAGLPRRIRGDRRRLQEIFQNVAGNAVKFTEKGAVAIRVGVRRRGEVLWLEAEVRDSGVGMEPEAQARIFEPFDRGDAATSARFDGFGLGLAIVRRRLAAMGGEISLNSSSGEGSVFSLRWPVAPLAEEGTQISDAIDVVIASAQADPLVLARQRAVTVLAGDAQAEAARRTAPQLAQLRRPALDDRPMRVLVAEDNAINGRVIEKILAGAGCQTRLVGDGETALRLMLRENFDVILLDLNMPRLGGVDVARIHAFARPLRRAPVLALTADDSAERRRLCRKAGMLDCLPKPIAPQALLNAIASARAAPPPAMESSRGASPLDAATLDALARLGGPDFLCDLVVQFAGDGGRLVEEIQDSFSRGDVEQLRRQAHALESVAGNVGASALARLCRNFRAASGDRLTLSAPRECGRLEREWRRTQEALGAALAA